MRARMPRSRLRLSPSELEVGERGTVGPWDLQVDKERRVYVRKTAVLQSVFGPQPWPDHNQRGEAMLVKTETGWLLVLAESFRAPINRNLDHEDYKELIAVDELLFLGRGTSSARCAMELGTRGRRKGGTHAVHDPEGGHEEEAGLL